MRSSIVTETALFGQHYVRTVRLTFFPGPQHLCCTFKARSTCILISWDEALLIKTTLKPTHSYHRPAMIRFAFLALLYLQSTQGSNIVLTNDDGWAVALVRAQNDALKAAGHNVGVNLLYRCHHKRLEQVVLSCPAENKSGTGSSSAPATVLASTCEFDTCPKGSPAEGFNASDRELISFLEGSWSLNNMQLI